MNNIRKITTKDKKLLKNFIKYEKEGFDYFFKLGWSEKNILDYLKNNNNASLAYFEGEKIVGFLIGELIKEEKYNNLEIYIIYISIRKRREKIGTKLLNYFISNKKNFNISKIYLEVSEDNVSAIKFYEKNNFVFLNFRHNYYSYNNKLLNALCYMMKI